ncbi:MAG: siphovirus ReqiPepy6 Gp37-like family protein [Acutalibacteraceae bacterium]|nr:siphovirus ReqiPepy6 Gp37-like family protein [Acutalibacteraceae bacterium]
MELYVYDLNFNLIGMIESCSCKSIIWTENYYACDDFQIEIPYNKELLDILKVDYFIKKNSSNRAMLIESIYITSSYNNGRKCPIVTIKGRGTECILERRVIAYNATVTDSVCNIARKAVINNLTSPSVSSRKISCVVLGTFPESETIDHIMQGENLLNFVQNLLQTYKFGFYFKLNFEHQRFDFTIHSGTDRSTGVLNKVEFSPDLDNFHTPEYFNESNTHYNCCIARSGEDMNGSIVIAVPTEPAGLERRELYRDCSDYDVSDLPSTAVSKILTPLQKEFVEKNSTSENIEGRIVDGVIFSYNTDYFIGDVVIVNDGFGHKLKKRLISMTEYYSCGSRVLTPVFEDV